MPDNREMPTLSEWQEWLYTPRERAADAALPLIRRQIASMQSAPPQKEKVTGELTDKQVLALRICAELLSYNPPQHSAALRELHDAFASVLTPSPAPETKTVREQLEETGDIGPRWLIVADKLDEALKAIDELRKKP